VQIRGPDGRVVVMRIFRAGDSFRVPDEDGLTLMTGNAGGIEIVVDGTVVPAIGPFGAVRRNVALDPERLRAGSSTAR
jgi:cytoskeleton protein RodZ